MRRWFGFAAMLLSAAGSEPRAVWTGPGASHLGSISADGRYLTGVDAETGELLLRDLTNGLKLRLTSRRPKEFAYFSVISPDSKQVAYAWFNDQGFYDLRVTAIEKPEPRVVYSNEEAGFVQPCAFSPDSKQILTLLFRKDNISQIALMNADSGQAKVLKSLNWVYPKRMDFSPDGRSIVYDSFARDGESQRDIFLLSSDGAKERRLVESPGEDVFPVFSRDGKRVYFSSDRGGEPALWSVDVATGEQRKVRDRMDRFLPIGITNRGEFFYANRIGGTSVYRAGIDLASGKLTTKAELLGEGASAVWSPDGKSIAWLARRTAENFGQDSRYIAIDGRAIATKLAHIERIRYSRDGATLYASGSDGKARGGVFAVNPSDGKVSPVDRDPEAPYRGYAATDGYYAKGREVRKIGEEKAVYVAAKPVEALAVSPNGETLAISDGVILTILDHGPPRFLPRYDSVSAIEWTPGGKALLAVRGDEIWRIPLNDSEPVRVARMAAPAESLSLHPSGKEILFTAGKPRTEVWSLRVE